MRTLFDLPAGLPEPQDDGACEHLSGTRIPGVSLTSSAGTSINLAQMTGRTIGMGSSEKFFIRSIRRTKAQNKL